MLRARGLARRFGARTLFEGVDLQLEPGDRVGLVGPNGEGKTTLLRILAGLDAADEGEIACVRNASVGYLRQEVDPTSERSVMEAAREALAFLDRLEEEIAEVEAQIAACGGDPPAALASRYERLRATFEARGGYEAEATLRATLTGLGLGPERWERSLRTLSGGWIMRVELAKLLVARPDVLLLDEPTNHLDLPSIAWFEGWLRDYPGAAVVASHDRTFLDRHATAIVELAGARATRYAGNYSAYLSQKGQRARDAASRVQHLDRQIAHLERFTERFGAKATKARQAQSKRKAIERLERDRGLVAGAAAPPRARAPRFRFPIAPRSGEVVLRLESLRKAYGELLVYEDLDLEIRRGERIALVGPNGAGKSTLLRLCAGVLAPDAGVRELGHNVRLAFYAQHQLEALDPRRSVLEEIESVAALEDVPRLRGLLGTFLFSGDDVEKRVSVLSGGEKARLALAKLLLARANVLVLDEPTNHLDLRAREVVTEALGEYEGTLLFISHDRTLINALATRVLEVTRPGRSARLRSFPGGYDDYLERVAREQRAAPAAQEPARASTPVEKRASPRRPAHTIARLRRRSSEIEAAITSAEAELERVGWLMAEPEAARDGERMRALLEEHRALVLRRDELYGEWERLEAEIGALELPRR